MTVAFFFMVFSFPAGLWFKKIKSQLTVSIH